MLKSLFFFSVLLQHNLHNYSCFAPILICRRYIQTRKMESFILGPIYNLLITEMYIPIKRQFFYCFCAGAEIAELDRLLDELSRTKEKIQEKIQEAELDQKRPNQEVKDWLVKVEGAETNVISLKNEHEKQKLHICGCSCNFLANVKTGRSLTRKIAMLNELKNNAPTEIATSLAHAVREVPVAWHLVGQRNYLNEALVYLSNHTDNVIGIHGMGGVGKTTLLERINNYHTRIEQIEFNYVVYVSIGQNCDLFMIQKDIACRVHLNISDDESVQSRATSIFNFFREKNFLLLLDDIWEMVDLTEVGIPLRSGTTYKQKILFTTRSQQICAQMQADKKLEVSCLEWEDAWDLFKSKVGGTLLSDPRVRKEAEVLARKCYGLPLAISVVGLAMSDKTFKEWKDTIKLLEWCKLPEVLKEDDRLFPVLKISYDNLKDETTKMCFLFCSLICHKQSFSARFIIERWIGLGCFEELDNIQQAYDMGLFVVKNLKKASLLEGDIEKDQFKMHDVVADLALWMACDCQMQSERWLVIDKNSFPNRWSNAERISILPSAVRLYYTENPQVQYLGYDLSKEPFDNGNSKLQSLSFVDCKFLEYIPTNIFLGNSSLKYLDLSETCIDSLPKGIGTLKNLEFLNLSNTKIKSLPKVMGHLVKLKYLHVQDAHLLSKIYQGMVTKLVNLHLLNLYGTMLQLGVQGGIGYEEIECLSRLGYLGITVTDVISFKKIINLPNITTLYLKIQDTRGLTSLCLFPGNLIHNYRTKFLVELSIERCKSLVELVIEESIWSFNRLEKFALSSLLELRMIVWQGVEPHTCFNNLVELEITACKNLLDVTWVLHLQSLKTLDVKYCAKMKQLIADDAVVSSSSMATFPELKKLCLWDVPEMIKVCNDEVCFPSLQSARFVGCKNLKRLPLGICETERKVEISGYMDWWDSLEWNGPHTKSHMEASFNSYG
jgi:disease resistance protein RPS2